MSDLIPLLALGLTMGAQHALDADHLAAVATLGTRGGKPWRIGALWGLGHTLTLLAMGFLVLSLRVPLSAGTEQALERLVGVMLVVLGARVILRHAAASPHAHVPARGVRAFVVGCVHGLAGSGALIVLVAASLPAATVPAALAAMLVFGLGTLVGMSATSVALALPFQASRTWPERAQSGLRVAAGLASVALGCWIILEPAAPA